MQHKIQSDLQNADFTASGSAFKTPNGPHLVWGTSVPADASTGYPTGCLYLKTNGTAGATLYVNEGSTTSSDFNAK